MALRGGSEYFCFIEDAYLHYDYFLNFDFIELGANWGDWDD